MQQPQPQSGVASSGASATSRTSPQQEQPPPREVPLTSSLPPSCEPCHSSSSSVLPASNDANDDDESEFVDERFTRAQPRLTYHAPSTAHLHTPAQQYRNTAVSLAFVTLLYSTVILVLFQVLYGYVFGVSSRWQRTVNLGVPCVLLGAWAVSPMLVHYTAKIAVQCLWSVAATLLALSGIGSIASIASWLGPAMRHTQPLGAAGMVFAIMALLLVLFLMALLAGIALTAVASIVASIVYVYQLELDRSTATAPTPLNVFASRTPHSDDDC